jgi:hypothetical protein
MTMTRRELLRQVVRGVLVCLVPLVVGKVIRKDGQTKPLPVLPPLKEKQMIAVTVRDDSAKCDPSLFGRAVLDREGVLVHTTDGVNSQGWLQGGSAKAGKPASCDFLVQRDGTIIRLVPRGTYSYHAGVCKWEGRVDRAGKVSQLLIGVEVENADSAGQTPTEVQHIAVAALILRAAWHHAFSPLSVYGHYGLAYPMGRRSDPYGFDWGYVMWLLAHNRDALVLTGDKAF